MSLVGLWVRPTGHIANVERRVNVAVHDTTTLYQTDPMYDIGKRSPKLYPMLLRCGDNYKQVQLR